MGTIATPSYATIYIGKFEETHIFPFIGNDCMLYAIYINDILFLYTGSDENLTEFLISLNIVHDSIKFDHKKIITLGNISRHLHLHW